MLTQRVKNEGEAKDECCRRNQKWMLEPEVNAQARSECSSQKWMLESELNALCKQELNDTIKRWRLPRNELVQTAIFSERDAFRIKAAEI